MLVIFRCFARLSVLTVFIN